MAHGVLHVLSTGVYMTVAAQPVIDGQGRGSRRSTNHTGGLPKAKQETEQRQRGTLLEEFMAQLGIEFNFDLLQTHMAALRASASDSYAECKVAQRVGRMLSRLSPEDRTLFQEERDRYFMALLRCGKAGVVNSTSILRGCSSHDKEWVRLQVEKALRRRSQ